MKIVFLAKFFDRAGTTTHMMTLGKEYISRGHEVLLIIAKPRDDGEKNLMNMFLAEGFKIHLTKFKVVNGKKINTRIMELYGYLFELPRSINRIKKFDAEIIHVHWPVTSYIGKIYSLIYRIPFITTLHIKDAPRSVLHQKPNGIIAISSEVYEDAVNIYGMEKEKIFTVFNGVDNKIFRKNEDIKSNEKKINILHVGSLSYRKGIDVLVKACENLAEKNIDFELTLVGDIQDKKIEYILKTTNIKDKIKNFTFQNPKKFYEKADIFVLASRKEGFPLVPLEAMLMEIPVIRSGVEGAKDQIENGIDGYIFENENYFQLSGLLIILAQNKSKREKIGLKGKEKAEKFFLVEKMANDTIEVYRKVGASENISSV